MFLDCCAMLWRKACTSTDRKWSSQLFWITVLLLHALFDSFCSSQKSLWWWKIHSFHKGSIKLSPFSVWHRGMHGTRASHSVGSGRWKQILCCASCQLCSMISLEKGSQNRPALRTCSQVWVNKNDVLQGYEQRQTGTSRTVFCTTVIHWRTDSCCFSLNKYGKRDQVEF